MTKLIKGQNDLLTVMPELCEEWHPTKNGDKKPSDFLPGSGKKAWWLGKCGHSWEAVISSRAKLGRGCPVCSHNKIVGGVNDLATVCPNVLPEWDYEKNNVLPSSVAPKSKNEYWWKCQKGHSYKMAAGKKTSRGFGCPICSNSRVLKGYNDLKTTDPKLAEEWHPTKNGSLTPEMVTYGSGKKIWWLCPRGHEWVATPHDRHNSRTGCPICSSRRSTSFPEQAIYFYIKQLFPNTVNRYKELFDNGMELDIFIPEIRFGIEFDGRLYHATDEQHRKEAKKYDICKSKKIYLIRIKEKHKNIWKDTADDVYVIPKDPSYKVLGSIIQHILDGIDYKQQMLNSLVPYDNREVIPHSSVIVNLEKDRMQILSYLTDIEDSLAKQRPDIAEQWDYEKNKPLTPEMFSYGSNDKVWWKCTVCGKSYKTSINHKNRNDSRCCPDCAKIQRGQSFTKNYVNNSNSLRATHPLLAEEFHPTLNGDLTPDTITAGRFKPVWWKCKKCGFEWNASPNNRKKGVGCPHCSGRVPIPGLDDLLTVNPILCEEWDYEKNTINPSSLTPKSGKKVWWKCKKCGHSWQAVVSSRSKGHGCPKCNHRKH